MKTLIQPTVKIKEIAAIPEEGQSLEDLQVKVETAGNVVKLVDKVNNKIILWAQS